MSTVDNNTNDFRLYPRNFFNEETGAGAKNAQEALCWWPWRYDRPKPNMMDNEVPDGNMMLKEISDIRSNLRFYVGKEYFKMVKARAKKFGLINEATGEHAVLTKDLKAAISTLQNTPENNELVYKIFNDFHKDRDWMANCIDRWMYESKMNLEPQVNEGKKLYPTNRGGFSAVARHAKSNINALFKDNLYKAQNWCLASSLPSTKAQKTDPKTYTPATIEIAVGDNLPPKVITYYVVTPPTINANAASATRVNADISQFVDIDYAAIAKCLKSTTTKVRLAITSHVYFKEQPTADNGSDDTGGEQEDEAVTPEAVEMENNINNELINNTVTTILEAINNVESDLSATATGDISTPSAVSKPSPNTESNLTSTTTPSLAAEEAVSEKKKSSTSTPLIVWKDMGKRLRTQTPPSMKGHLFSSVSPKNHPTSLFPKKLLTSLSPNKLPKSPSNKKKETKVRQYDVAFDHHIKKVTNKYVTLFYHHLI
jgi:hypothetical protein